ncbi:sigma-70 family RNA polymerase sigma factor [Spongiactinospora sp. TRM90649]|uniref:sigma-70 family RNA polymerase sigma factor n=1 Tax=Spongiactinospora sp. TRM90649 TaxID=3031114 RepID=UPI0023F84783|nr:sigma-70 family RNA polymerase sigma factor [Spongiactinospora sp. TRM90649]MDF5752122.1 sigma-70 family RNA polymerase sigma factor [Spongiactinospora sp. TRM90649]
MHGHDGAARAEPYEPYDETDLLGQYLLQIGRTPLLSAQQEVELSRRIEAGLYARHLLDEGVPDGPRAEELESLVRDGEAAKDHMLRANLRLVVSTAKKYGHRGWPMLDVIQEGNLGLIRAVEKFDYAKGFKFSTYAMWWIRQAIERGLADKTRTVRLPVHIMDRLSKVHRMERQLLTRLNREPTDQEVARASGLSLEELLELRRIGHDTVSLDTPVGDGEETRVGDLIADTEVVPVSDLLEYQALAEELRALVDTLPEREAFIVSLRYGLTDGKTHTYQEIGERLGLTRERIRQLERQALRSLRSPEHVQPLLDWAS